MILPPWVKPLAIALILAVTYFVGRDHGRDACEAEQAVQDARNAALAAAGVAKSAAIAAEARSGASGAAVEIEEKTHADQQAVRIEYRDRPVPVDCRRPDRVQDRIEQAVDRANRAVRAGARPSGPAVPNGGEL